jgi:hypothetical protein
MRSLIDSPRSIRASFTVRRSLGEGGSPIAFHFFSGREKSYKCFSRPKS